MKADLSQRKFYPVFLILLFVLFFPATGFSLDNEAWNTGLNFRFYPPGARALGMGGAFVALADDATAAASNPAGIAQLQRMQLAIEGRYVSTDGENNAFPYAGGRYYNNSELDDEVNVSFGAFTTPLPSNLGNISIYYDKPMSYSTDKSARQTFTGFPENTIFASYPSSLEINIDEVGASVAESFCDGRIMLGAGLGLQFFSLEGNLNRFDHTANPPLPPWPDPYNRYTTDEDDIGVSFRAGILAKPIDNLRLGLSYTHMPRFGYTVSVVNNNFIPPVTFDYSSKFNVPDNLAFGAAYNILPNWVLVFEGKWVMYSELMDGFQIATVYGDAPPDGFGGRILSDKSEYSIDDIVELHFGTEYVLDVIPNMPIALRAGFFYEPAHDLEYTRPAGRAAIFNVIETNTFDGGDDLMHYTFGTGAVFANHYQVDIGADITEESHNIALSMVYQF